MRVCVLGAGTMGQGIAQVSAMAGNSVTIRDIESSFVANGLESIEQTLEGGVEREKISPETKAATMSRLEGETDLNSAIADADLVIEAIPEDLELKQETFVEMETIADPDTVLATNTSSLSVSEITSVLDDPERALGMHFFNPVHIMDLVEIVEGEKTNGQTINFAESFVEEIDKTPITITDSPGFATSRLGVTLGVEAVRMVETGVATPHAIDNAMELGYNHPMGPLELTDVVGLDIRLDVLDYLHDELGERFRPPQLLKRKVRAGKLGKKTGEGFYVWEGDEIVGVSEN